MSWTPGRVAYQLFYRPKAAWKAISRRGVISTLVDCEHHRRMMRAAAELPCPDREGAETVRVHFLTGKKFWHQTVFCAWSLSHSAGVNVIPVIHDDGSLDDEINGRFRRCFPRCEIVPNAEAIERLDQHLPTRKFPALRERRQHLPLFRKLLDVHAGTAGWKLFLDSDMLFFRRPDVLMDWLKSPGFHLHMVDVETCYGYPVDFLSRQVGRLVPDRVNTGITGIDSSRIDWDRVESLVAEQLKQFGPHYYAEQAIVAQILSADPGLLALPAQDYLVMPDEAEVRQPTAIVQHYVAQTKPWYYRYAWRNAMELPSAGQGSCSPAMSASDA
jgi:phage tail protein X